MKRANLFFSADNRVRDQSGRGQPRHRTSRRKGCCSTARSVLECGCPLPLLLLKLATMFLMFSVGRAQPLSIRTMAGAAAQGSTNGFGSNARLNHPTAVAADTAGNIYVADTENSTHLRLNK